MVWAGVIAVLVTVSGCSTERKPRSAFCPVGGRMRLQTKFPIQSHFARVASGFSKVLPLGIAAPTSYLQKASSPVCPSQSSSRAGSCHCLSCYGTLSRKAKPCWSATGVAWHTPVSTFAPVQRDGCHSSVAFPKLSMAQGHLAERKLRQAQETLGSMVWTPAAFGLWCLWLILWSTKRAAQPCLSRVLRPSPLDLG